MTKKKEELNQEQQEIKINERYLPIPFTNGLEEIIRDLKIRNEKGSVTYGIEILDECCEYIRPGTVTLIMATPNCLDLNTSILTTEGFKKVTELTYKDKVLNSDGEVCNIVSFTDTDEIDCYEIKTTDSRRIISSYNHNHPIYYYGTLSQENYQVTRGYKHEYWTSEKIYKEAQKPHRKNKIFIKEFNDVHTKDKKLPVDPYILGVLIGDGCLTCAGLRYCKPSQKVFDNVKSRLPEAEVRFSSNKKDVIINDGGYIKQYIKNVGLNVHSYEKFIPEEYKVNLSKKQKLDLLQGLLDTDGHQAASYNEFSTTSEQLAKDVQQLAWSLGYRCTIKTRMGKYKKNGIVKETRLNYRVTISNTRKKAQCVIKSVTKVAPRKTRCITIDNPNHTIVTDNYVVTSNTGKSLVAQGIATHIARQGKDVIFSSCEMSAGLLMERELKKIAGITSYQLSEIYKKDSKAVINMLTGVVDNKDFDYLKRIQVMDIGGIHIDELLKIYDQYPDVKYIIVDYIQRIKGDGNTEYEQLKDVSYKLQIYAMEKRKSIIVCSQIPKTNENESRNSKDSSVNFMQLKAKGAGNMEEDAHIAIKMAETYEHGERFVLINLSKNKYGSKKFITYKYQITPRLEFELKAREV